jgi:hypothetical protein
MSRGKKSFLVDPPHADQVEDLIVVLRGRRSDLARAYQALEDVVKGGSPRIIYWEAAFANELSIRMKGHL